MAPDAGFTCPACGHIGADDRECPRCGVVFDKFRKRLEQERAETSVRPAAVVAPEPLQAAPVALPEPRIPSAAQSAPPADDYALERMDFYNFKINALALPIALLCVLVAQLTVLPTYLMRFFSIMLHEVGHSMIAWFSSRFSIPLPSFFGVGVAQTAEHKSAAVYLVCLLAIAGLCFAGWRSNRKFYWVLAGALFVCQTAFTFVIGDKVYEQVLLLAGRGGELVLGALCSIAFYYRLPDLRVTRGLDDKLTWDHARFVVLFIGAYGYATQLASWIKLVRHGGSEDGIAGEGYEQSDMVRLFNDFGWSEQRMVRVYLWLALVCGLVVVGHYLYFLVSPPSTAKNRAKKS